jgi:adenylosuccinate synthase
MSVWVVVGGQYGSEGKGKISAYLTLEHDIDICVRCGGPNSGHCFVDDIGASRALRQIPAGFVRAKSRLLIPSGGLIELDVLRHEIESLKLGPERVGIDRSAMIIEQTDRQKERDLGLDFRLSSTLCGVGSAVSRRVLRGDNVRLAESAATQSSWLKPYLTDVSHELNAGIDSGKKVLVEGTQGFGLSLYHSGLYPKTTSRDTSAAGCISECGISPRLITNIVMVLRTFPIRVAGEQAGPMQNEIDWRTIQEESETPNMLTEFTTVTRKPRRIARFDSLLAKSAAMVNRPTELALNFLDYVSAADSTARNYDDLSVKSRLTIDDIEALLEVRVAYVGVGQTLEQTFSTGLDHRGRRLAPTADRFSLAQS